MKILLLGATGKLGQQLLTQSLERDHLVTALVRTPAKITVTHPNLTVVAGDAINADNLSTVVKGKDAVISALGVGDSLKSQGLLTAAVKALLPAMEQHDVRRLLFVSAFGVGPTLSQANFIQKIFFRYLLKDIYSDKGRGDEMIRHSKLDWTIIMPVKLTNGKATGKYAVGETMAMKGMPMISREDTASFILDTLDNTSWVRKSPIVMKS
jgi:putative NADH-flavin reductase